MKDRIKAICEKFLGSIPYERIEYLKPIKELIIKEIQKEFPIYLNVEAEKRVSYIMFDISFYDEEIKNKVTLKIKVTP
jgi:hypothetical protein